MHACMQPPAERRRSGLNACMQPPAGRRQSGLNACMQPPAERRLSGLNACMHAAPRVKVQLTKMLVVLLRGMQTFTILCRLTIGDEREVKS